MKPNTENQNKQSHDYLLKNILLSCFLILVGYMSFCLAFPLNPLDELCKPDSTFQNLYNFTEEELKIISIASTIQKSIQFNNGRQGSVTQAEVLDQAIETRRGECIHYAILLGECLNREGIENKLIIVNFTENTGGKYHAFITTELNGQKRILDPSGSNALMINLFRGGFNFSEGIKDSFWYGYSFGIYNLTDMGEYQTI